MPLNTKLTTAWMMGWSALAPHFHLRAGTVNLRVRNTSWGARGLAYWKPDWKTTLITTILSRRSGTFLDVGANVGQTLIDYISAAVPNRYVGFEPNALCVQQINQVIADNDLSYRCSIVPIGLSNKTEVIPLYSAADEANDTGATIVADLRPDRHYVVTRVPVYRLDDLVESLDIADTTLMKIDVEGAELQVLQGMPSLLKTTKPWIICEILHRDSRADEQQYVQQLRRIEVFFDDHNYEVLRLIKDSANMKVVDLVGTTSFPNEVFDSQSDRECDYLLVPVGDAALAREIITREVRKAGRSLPGGQHVSRS